MAKPVVLPSRTFPTQSAAESYFRSILHGYAIGEVVSDPFHHQLLLELNDRHRAGTEKAGVGIAEFYIDKPPDEPGRIVRADARGIWIRRTDGSPVDWSFLTAIRSPSKYSDVSEALRMAVSVQRQNFRERAFAAGPVFCAFTGVVLRDLHQADVVYRNPRWSQLIEGFVKTVPGGLHAIATDSGFGEIQLGQALTDGSLVSAWRIYYDANANPIIVASDEGGKGKRLPIKVK